MFWYRVKTKRPAADKAETVILQPASIQAAKLPYKKADVTAKRKPSERFMRKAVSAKSRASHSERLRLADLTKRLKATAKDEAALNEAMKLSCFRPEDKWPPV